LIAVIDCSCSALGDTTDVYKIPVGKPETRDYMEDRRKCEDNIKDVKVWTVFSWLGTGSRGGLL
jgi:hypothetical protein